MDKVWYDIPEFEGKYTINKEGEVYSLPKIKGCFFSKGKVLSQSLHKEGYRTVHLCKPNYRKRMLVHRIVAEVFIPNPNNLPEVNHIDSNKQNNKVSNLEWCTGLQNKKHAILNNLTVKGIKNGKSKLVEEQVYRIRELLKQGVFQKEISKQFGINQGTVSAINLGKIWNHLK